MTKERPIIFSTPMVKALLNGTKTQTRRIAKNVPDTFQSDKIEELKNLAPDYFDAQSPYGKPGDLLWVREAFRPASIAGVDYMYRASIPESWEFRWKPSIHMPKKAARIWLLITDVRVEKLQDISEEDAKAEGVKFIKTESGKNLYWCYLKSNPHHCNTYAKTSFTDLWQSIHGSESWQQNPYVWVVEFKVVSTTGKEAQNG